MDSCSKCPTPDEIVSSFIQGFSIESLVKQVHFSHVFARKSLARGYVVKSIYDYEVLQKKTGFNK